MSNTNGKVYVTATFNNTLVSITDTTGNVVAWGSAGSAGFKGARRSTPFAATTAVDTVARKAMAKGIREVEVFLKGPGSGRDAALRALKSAGMKMNLIADVTPVPHNGVRLKKRRRV
ncbi:MAG: 30S ribosomal protein S11 [Candidatus Amesbacteria bacterium GW2011_GWA2_42_12]|uniref:Small ribosomal subunit protein uS11 n=1 Tax=Candidatus Amesbacteria bacterium GW2011_GWA2_42_12 TaxID=1618356 RepID=A0A0G1B6X8_9BACT|nr:MAG: 30S ribosomal protein S11 [Candidatus Amesbacteria bacterium GW2011_GWA2_42_12]